MRQTIAFVTHRNVVGCSVKGIYLSIYTLQRDYSDPRIAFEDTASFSYI